MVEVRALYGYNGGLPPLRERAPAEQVELFLSSGGSPEGAARRRDTSDL